MADKSNDSEQEPSIEEILTSIRQIISDDEDEGEEEISEEEVIEEPEESEEIIELTQKADPEPVTEDASLDDFEPEPVMEEPEPEPEPGEGGEGEEEEVPEWLAKELEREKDAEQPRFGTVSGRVLDGTGEPVGEAEVVDGTITLSLGKGEALKVGI